MADTIDQTISVASRLSYDVSGYALVPYAEQGERKTAGVQLIPVDTDSNFEVKSKGVKRRT
ncbi:MAG: hypothetical protein OXI53_11830 [Nitrospira sp.]|nr:hypothetical protein [Nitrospira sp.]MDE0503041.1 hypothetical protein [Candidatus Poribacteria bacterium]